MERVLITGATGFVGHHLAKRLVAEGASVRALARPTSSTTRLAAMGVDLAQGDIEDPATLPAAMKGIDTLYHVAGLVSSAPRMGRRCHAVNTVGTKNVLDAAAVGGIGRVVVTSTVAAIGVNREPVALNEEADWDTHRYEFPYALTKRSAEEDALSRARDGLHVVVVNPSIVIGPEDFQPTSGTRTIRDLLEGRIPAYIKTGLAYVDVRDVAEGHLLAARHGRSGERYILSAHDLMLGDFLRRAAMTAGVRWPRLQVPYPVVYTAALASEAWAGLRRRDPGISRNLIRITGRYGWYDATKAKRELGWNPRPLDETLRDTVGWFRSRVDG